MCLSVCVFYVYTTPGLIVSRFFQRKNSRLDYISSIIIVAVMHLCVSSTDPNVVKVGWAERESACFWLLARVRATTAGQQQRHHHHTFAFCSHFDNKISNQMNDVHFSETPNLKDFISGSNRVPAY